MQPHHPLSHTPEDSEVAGVMHGIRKNRYGFAPLRPQTAVGSRCRYLGAGGKVGLRRSGTSASSTSDLMLDRVASARKIMGHCGGWSKDAEVTVVSSRGGTPFSATSYEGVPLGLDDVLTRECGSYKAGGFKAVSYTMQDPVDVIRKAEKDDRIQVELSEVLERGRVRHPSDAVQFSFCVVDEAEVATQHEPPEDGYENYLKYEAAYEDLSRMVTKKPRTRRNMTRIWWAKEVLNTVGASEKPLAELLEDDLVARRHQEVVDTLEKEESNARDGVRVFAEFLYGCIQSEAKGLMSETAVKLLRTVIEREEQHRKQVENRELMSRLLFHIDTEVRGLAYDEEDHRHDLVEEEVLERTCLEDSFIVEKPTVETNTVGVGTSEGPICTLCGFELSSRFCAETGEPHCASDRCDSCGMVRLLAKYCPATGRLHDRVFEVPSNWAAAPFRSSGPTIGVRQLSQQMLSELLTRGVSNDRSMEEIKAMFAPRMVMEIVRDLVAKRNVSFDHADAIYKSSLGYLNVPSEGGILPSTLQNEDGSSSDEAATSKAPSVASRRTHGDDGKSMRSTVRGSKKSGRASRVRPMSRPSKATIK